MSHSVQDVILDNLGSLHCCQSYMINGVIGNVYLNSINLHIEFDNIHVIYLFTIYYVFAFVGRC